MDALSSLNDLLTALNGALQPDQAYRKPYEEALRRWEGCAGFTTALLHLYTAPPPQLAPAERLLAVLCLKNAVNRRWHSRREDEEAIAESEKEAVRTGLLEAVQEPERQLASQLGLTVANIARLDRSPQWACAPKPY